VGGVRKRVGAGEAAPAKGGMLVKEGRNQPLQRGELSFPFKEDRGAFTHLQGAVIPFLIMGQFSQHLFWWGVTISLLEGRALPSQGGEVPGGMGEKGDLILQKFSGRL